ncbi:MAG: biosynthetic-type acetolactate synthase large subunit [Clostridiales bacterium]|nr:biosynthetic-type acetolactate synthase large subunit [Clostridiales bacterium]
MKMTGAQILVETLIEQGVDTVFGFPGGMVVDIYDKLYDKQDKIRHILTAHEEGAVHGADGYARATGKTGVVIATSGPGATNLVTGIATAYLDSIPLVAITGNVRNSMIGRDSFQEIDITGITLPITKHNFFVHKVQNLAEVVRTAFELAQSGRPGPVLIDIPKDVQEAVFDFKKKPVAKIAPVPSCSEEDIQKTVKLIKESKRPYIYFGGGALRTSIGEDIVKLADKLDAVIGCSMMGLSEVPTDSPRFLGMQGMHGRYASSVALAKADLIIAIGVRFSDRATGKIEKYAPSATKIHIDCDRAEIGKNVPVDLGICCDLKNYVDRLIKACPRRKNAEWIKKVEDLKQREADAYEGLPFLPRDAINIISDNIKPDTRLVTDVGQHQCWAAQFLKFRNKRTWITSGGLGTMGFGLGAAIGSYMGTGSRSVLITGDGSFGMCLNELATAVTYKVPVTIVIFNNHALGMVRQWQKVFFYGRYSNTTIDRKTDFVKLAQAFGAKGFKANDKKSFEEAFKKAYKCRGPVVIDLSIKSDSLVLPMLKPGGTFNNLILRREDISDAEG